VHDFTQRRAFLKRTLAAGTALALPTAARSQTSGVGPLDHVAVPLQNAEAMIAFYRALGFVVRDGAQIVSVHFADQKINFHRTALWQRETFTLRAPAARPPCGDFCWVWNGTEASLRATLARAGAAIEVEGQRDGARDGGNAVGQSIYTRDPDGNLLEFIRYA
jgi:catechol 2,3-dioxygenase-like lactoylglutathione lyase family enzyme